MIVTSTGNPNVVCAELRDALRADDSQTPRERAHLDAAVERIVHAKAGDAESVTVTLTATPTTFSLVFG